MDIPEDASLEEILTLLESAHDKAEEGDGAPLEQDVAVETDIPEGTVSHMFEERINLKSLYALRWGIPRIPRIPITRG